MSIGSKLVVLLYIAFLFYVININRSSAFKLNMRHRNQSLGIYRPRAHTLVKHVVSIRTRNYSRLFGDNHFCAGTIITPNRIVTAAHCLFRDKQCAPQDIVVVAGTPILFDRTNATKIMDVIKIIVHPRYKYPKYDYDIAMLVLKENLIFDDVYVAAVHMVHSQPRPGTECTVVGWGRVFYRGPIADEALYVDLYIWRNEVCRRRVKTFKPGMLCAGDRIDYDKDSCSGDAGGPLFCHNELVGIVSFGISCGLPNYPGIYTNIAFYRNWIEINSAAISDCSEHHEILRSSPGGSLQESLSKYVVSIRTHRTRAYIGDNHFCAASIVGRKCILTAAHCVTGAKKIVTRPYRLSAYAGNPNRLGSDTESIELQINRVIPHYKFRNSKNSNIALLLLKNALSLDNEDTDVISYAEEEIMPGSNCTVLGWSRIAPRSAIAAELVAINLQIVDRDICKDIYGNEFFDDMLCVKDFSDWSEFPCHGDPGAPLICNGIQYGVYTWKNYCGEPGKPTIFTAVSNYKNWIDSVCKGNRHNFFKIILLLSLIILLM